MTLWGKVDETNIFLELVDLNKRKIDILTCSAADYAKNQNQDLSSYVMMGIGSSDFNTIHTSYAKLKKMAGDNECCAVVDVREIAGERGLIRVIGTGLRLIKNAEPKDKGGFKSEWR